MSKIKSITKNDFAGTKYASVFLEDGTQWFARIIHESGDNLIVHFASQLILISKDKSGYVEPQVLCKGVTIR